MRRFTLSTLVAAAVAVAAPTAASAAQPVGTVGTAIPAPKVIRTSIDGVPMVETDDGGGGLPYLGVSHPYDAGDWESALVEYHDNGTYDAQLEKVDALADRWVKEASHSNGRHHGVDRGRRARTHGHHGAHHARVARKLAVVFDIDETSLSNWTAIKDDNFTYGKESQAEADNEIGTAIPSTLQVYDDAKKHGEAVFFVTGRPESQRAVTEDNLQREGYTGYQHVYLKPSTPAMTTVQYKTGARKDIESQGYKIVANIGDQYSDLAGGHAQRAFKLANPFYFLP